MIDLLHKVRAWWHRGNGDRSRVIEAEAELRKEVERHTEVSKYNTELAERQREDTVRLIQIADNALRMIRRGNG